MDPEKKRTIKVLKAPKNEEIQSLRGGKGNRSRQRKGNDFCN